MRNNNSRTWNVAKNAGVSLLCQLFNILLQFVNRTIFIFTLGKEYLGVGGLFSNILTILSVAELGISSAIVYSLYRPIARQDTGRIRAYVALYRRAYRTIGCAIAIAGLGLLPFLNRLIGETPNIRENLSLIYVLYLTNTVCTYFFSYKSAVLAADQRQYVVNLIHQLAKILQAGVQAVVLILCGSYIQYLVVGIVCTAGGNLLISAYVNREYPYLKEPAMPLSRQERKDFFQNIRALSVYKFASAGLNGTDNILITAMFSVAEVGLSANYLMITSAFEGVFSKLTNAFTGSIGNLNVQRDPRKQYDVFMGLFFLSAWLYGLAAVGILLLGNDVVVLWLGKDYLLDFATVAAIAVSFYVSGMHFAAYTYRTTLGLFRVGQIAPVGAAVLNILLSLWLGKKMGLCGIYIATAISRVLTTGIVDPVLVFRKAFSVHPVHYYVQYACYAGINVVLFFLLKHTVCRITLGGIPGIVLKIVLITALYCGVMVLVFGRTRQFLRIKGAIGLVKNKIWKKPAL